MDTAFVEAVLDVLFASRVPNAVRALIDIDAVLSRLVDYKLNPILPCGADGAPRVSYADLGEKDAWAQRLTALFPHDGLQSFLDSAPNAPRRMVDTDGDQAVVYLDDLHTGEHTYAAPGGHKLMCAMLRVPTGERTLLTVHATPPDEVAAHGVLGQLIEDVAEKGGGGMWGVQWDLAGNQPLSLLWVTESRWRRDGERTTRIADAVAGLPATWHTLAALARSAGMMLYVDGLERHADGRTDLTVGWLNDAPAS